MNFSFETNKLTPKQIIELADAQGLSPVRVSIQANGYRQSSSFWGEVNDVNNGNDRYPVISLGNDVDVVGKLARNIARSVQFPESSAYMHFIGCVSAAMLGRFTVEYHGTDQPTALYVVTSQPPSTGKSAVNSLALAPMVAEVERINDQRKKERKKIQAQHRNNNTVKETETNVFQKVFGNKGVGRPERDAKPQGGSALQPKIQVFVLLVLLCQREDPGGVQNLARQGAAYAADFMDIAVDCGDEDVEIVSIQGSVEIAPVIGLTDAIVDIVETGNTLVANGLVVFEDIVRVSSRLIANSASIKKNPEIMTLIDRLQAVVGNEEVAFNG